MSPRQARRERREAERKAKKLEIKKSRLAGTTATVVHPATEPHWNPELEDEFPRDLQIRADAMAALVERNTQALRPAPAKTEPIGFVSQNKPSRAASNRANAQHSTGPRTADGKLASSRNATKHGLASGQIIIPGEDPAAFETFLNDLLEEHQPTTPSENLLIQEMAQSHWLAQRALRLQNECFTADGVNEKQLALFLRYQTTHQRAFYKAFNSLLRLKKEQARTQRGFVSQTHPAAVPGFVSQNPGRNPAAPQFVPQNASPGRCNEDNEWRTQAA